MGNWGKVSELLNVKDKTEKACMEHYVDLYLHSFGSILPKVISPLRGEVFCLGSCFSFFVSVLGLRMCLVLFDALAVCVCVAALDDAHSPNDVAADPDTN